MHLLDDLLQLMVLLSLLTIIHQRSRPPKSSAITRHTLTGPPDVSLLDLTRRQLSDWRELLAESENSHAHPEQIAYCRRQVSRFEAEVDRLGQ